MLIAHRGSESSPRIFCLLLAIWSAQGAAQTVRGIVHNGTGGKPQSGDPVLLVTGADEIGRAVSGKNGDFRIEPKLPSGASPDTLKVRVLHDGVSYQQPVRVGVASDVTVYDGSAQVDGLSEYLGIFQFEARVADRLEVTELHAIQNDSWPPRTSTNPHSFDLALPDGAQNLFVTITEAEGQSAKLSMTDPSTQHGPYKFGVPLKPGLTKYVITYQLPYRGELRFRRSAQYSTKKSFVVLPMAMHFTPFGTLQFHPVPDDSGAQVREIDSLAQNDVLAFQVSGTGVLAQAFRPMTGSNASARQALPNQPGKVEAPQGDTLLTSPGSASAASNQSSQKAVPPAAHSEPVSRFVRNWAGPAFALLVLGTLIAWKISRTRSGRRPT